MLVSIILTVCRERPRDADAGQGIIVGDGVGDASAAVPTLASLAAYNDPILPEAACFHALDANCRQFDVAGQVILKGDAAPPAYSLARATDNQVVNVNSHCVADKNSKAVSRVDRRAPGPIRSD